ncbi:uncharacterized protein [Venturia canescens]|uniref:uncharacterized protein isoform X2 n=1 Tax=Venturia canescens TaxID=32260 RepID=UPI001C9CA845|nr:uncharacterized protein LOC122409757 isoform X2 [Venturia canescens]
MSKLIKYSDDLLGWKRKAGPLKVWGVVEGRKKTSDGKTLRFSIQEVPEDRFDDVLDLMCKVFIKDEPICDSLNAIEDPVTIEDFCKLWSFPLQKGIVVGAFLIDGDEPKPILAGVNMTVVFRSETATKMLRLMGSLEKEKDVRRFFNVDKILSAFGLCVDPEFRGQGLGYELLRARDEMAVAYNLQATSTVFTSTFAAKNAARAGFEVLVERDFADVRNEDGTRVFPGMVHKSVKLMGKKF